MPPRKVSGISDEEFKTFVSDLTLPLAEALEEEMGRNGQPTDDKRLERYRLVQARIELLKEGTSKEMFHHSV